MKYSKKLERYWGKDPEKNREINLKKHEKFPIGAGFFKYSISQNLPVNPVCSFQVPVLIVAFYIENWNPNQNI